jgi:hypothetical protein
MIENKCEYKAIRDPFGLEEPMPKPFYYCFTCNQKFNTEEESINHTCIGADGNKLEQIKNYLKIELDRAIELGAGVGYKSCFLAGSYEGSKNSLNDVLNEFFPGWYKDL